MLEKRSREIKNHSFVTKPEKWFARLIIFFLIGLGFGSGVVSAEYLGPDRVHQITTYDTCGYGVWADENSTCTNAANQQVHCTICTWECNHGSACGSATYWYTLGTRLSPILSPSPILKPRSAVLPTALSGATPVGVPSQPP